MSRKCDLCGKEPSSGNIISHSHRTTRRRWLPNIQTVRVLKKNGTKQKMSVCTGCIRSGKTLGAF
jgi:large subunit ribosomal protein L28